MEGRGYRVVLLLKMMKVVVGSLILNFLVVFMVGKLGVGRLSRFSVEVVSILSR